MPEVSVRNLKNEELRRLELAEEIFGYPLKRHLLYEAVHHQLAARRSGTAKTKNRTEIQGGGRKPWRQKHTGRARHGSTRSPLWRSGGTVFGPQPRSYDYAFPKKARRSALRSALSQKVREEKLIVLDSLRLDSHRTRDLLAVLSEGLAPEGKTLMVYDGENRNLRLAARNLSAVTAVRSPAVSVVDLLRHDTVLVTEAALEQLMEVLGR
jgi:large subunit ribosomal protein L4